MDKRAKLLLLADVAGPVFGTQDFALFLHSLVRMHVPETIVEFGTGLGVSSFWMAAAVKRNGVGHVWTVDNLMEYDSSPVLRQVIAKLLPPDRVVEPEQYLREVARLLELEPHITFVNQTIDFSKPGHFDRYPFGDKPIDLLFSDFRHGALDILSFLAQALPRMAPASSIFLDSASTNWPCFLLLEQLTAQLNQGRAPASLQERSDRDLRTVLADRRIVLVHLTKVGRRDQNGTAWLKLEPLDLVPHPRTAMGGGAPGPVAH